MMGSMPGGINMGGLGSSGMIPIQMGMMAGQGNQPGQAGKKQGGKEDTSGNKSGVSMMPMQGMGMPMMGKITSATCRSTQAPAQYTAAVR